MKFSLNWLREFVELPANADELAELLTMAGVEIEGIEKRGGDFDKVVVAQIRESKQHPNADRLSVCSVDDGSGTSRQIVCGAKNYKAGDKVPLALPGAHLPNGLDIRKSKLRGIESEGMLCSPIEIGLGDDASGLLILSADAKVGAPLSQLLPPDVIFDVEITPNRPDLLSHFGLAREIAALLGKPVRDLGARFGEAALAQTNSGVRVAAPNECPFFSVRRVDDVTVGPSPNWLRTKVESVGLRSINNIVDISNYVMLELGQPTHAFDAAKLRGEINVRLAHEGEKILALDGRTYSLGQHDLVVADEERAIGIGGVMGGEETGVSASTRSVLLEAAYFRASSVRRTARRLNLLSDASYRFERGVDPQMVLVASQRASDLIREIAGGSASSEISVAGSLPESPSNVQLRYERLNRVIGTNIDPPHADKILSGFGFQKSNGTRWKIPSYRRDVSREEDLIEEVVRGFDIGNVPNAMRSRFTPASAADRAVDAKRALRQRLVSAGFSEARSSVLLPRGTEAVIELRNPLNEENAALRPSLLPGLFDVLARNLRAGLTSIRIFELGRVFAQETAEESEHLAVILHGDAADAPHWRHDTKRKLDLFDVKGAIELLGQFSFRRSANPAFAISAGIMGDSEQIGAIGQLTAARAAELGASSAVVFAEVKLDRLLQTVGALKHREIDRFPSVTRDIAMIVPETLSHAEILRVLQSTNEPLLAAVQLFDIFSGESLGAGKRSLAYSLTYRDKTRTLTSDEVTAVHAKIRERLRSELGAELRE